MLGEGSKKKKKVREATQKTPKESVMVMGPTGKCHMEWRDWA